MSDTTREVEDYIAAAGIAPDVAVSVTSFGDRGDIQNQLAELVARGAKRATASLLCAYRDEQQLPQPGNLFVVVDGAGRPRCLCRTVGVEVKPFADVDAAFAADEGEGDGTLDDWRTAHRAFFEREGARRGLTFMEGFEVVLERFALLLA